jgi:phosphoribosylformylglycinamidine synthase
MRDKRQSDGFQSASIYNQITMKAHVYVTLKRTVLDPQGQTIQNALKKMQYKAVKDVRQGKYFVLDLDNTLDAAAAKEEVERIAREVLTNPVIEEFSYRLEEAE